MRALIRQMSRENPLWGAPRIHGELLMLGIEVAESTVGSIWSGAADHRPKVGRLSCVSCRWHRFAGSVRRTYDLFQAALRLGHPASRPQATSRDQGHYQSDRRVDRRSVTDAFPWDEAPRHLIRDRDGAFGSAYTRRIRAMGIRDHPTAPRSPWQNGHVERLIGSIRRECLDHLIFG